MRHRNDRIENEAEFGNALGEGWEYAPEHANIHEHWDITYKGYKFDVKDVPAASVPHKHGLRWVELINVRGAEGWILGKADFIAFTEPNRFIVVPRQKLLNMMILKSRLSEWTNQQEFKSKPKPYKLHSRKGREDLMMLVPLKDLEEIGTVLPRKRKTNESL